MSDVNNIVSGIKDLFNSPAVSNIEEMKAQLKAYGEALPNLKKAGMDTASIETFLPQVHAAIDAVIAMKNSVNKTNAT